MNKKKVFFGLVIASTVVILSSCDKKVSDPYAVEINKPVLFVDENPKDEIFSWAPVKGAEGYLIKIDDGEEVGIGNPVQVNTDGFTICHYVMNADTLAEGEHIVQFAAYAKDKVSEWTDIQTIFIKKEAKMKLSRPSLNSSLVFSADADIDRVEFDFGNGITASARLEELQYSQYGIDQIQVVGDPKSLGIAEKLKYDETYIVNVRTFRKNEESPVSNSVSYKFDNKFYNTIDTPTILFGQILFAEELISPSLTIKIENKEYSLVVVNTTSCLSVDSIIKRLIENKSLSVADAYRKNELSIAVKFNFDYNHYKGTEYSNTYNMTTNLVDEEIAKAIFDSFQSYYTKTEVMAQVANDFAEDFVTITAKIDNKDVSLVSMVTKTESTITRSGSTKYENGTKAIVFIVTYKRQNFTLSKEFKVNLMNTANIKVSNLMVNGSILSWNVIGDTTLIDYKFVVEVKSGDTLQSFITSSNSFDFKDLKILNDITITVYVVKNNKKIDSSASLAFTLKRGTASSTLSFNSGNYIVPANHKLSIYYSNGSSNTFYQNHIVNLQSLVNCTKLELIELGDGVTCFDSIPSVFNLSTLDVSSLVYTIEEAKYIVLRDFKLSEVLDSSYSSYILSDEEGNEKFDLATYNNNTSQNITLGKSNLSLRSSEENILILGSISPQAYFKFAPNIIITSTIDSANSGVSWTTSNNFFGEFEVLVEKLDENLNQYVKDEELSFAETKNTTINMTSANIGTYKISIRSLGNGEVITGKYTTITYYANGRS